jgi:hypothetical protein
LLLGFLQRAGLEKAGKGKSMKHVKSMKEPEAIRISSQRTRATTTD